MAYPKGKPKSESSKLKARISCLAIWTDDKRKEMSIKYSGKGNPFYGKKHRKDSIDKLVAINTGKKYGESTKMKISKSLIGNKRALGNTFTLTQAQKDHLSKIKTGLKKSEETRRKISLSKIGIPGWMKGKKHSEETRKKISLSKTGKPSGRSGPKSNFWRGGVSSSNLIIRGSKEMANWRRMVFKRDNFTCQMCNQKGGKLNADHIKPFAYYPDLRFDINNGRTLCVSCHKKTDTYGNKFRKTKEFKKIHLIKIQ